MRQKQHARVSVCFFKCQSFRAFCSKSDVNLLKFTRNAGKISGLNYVNVQKLKWKISTIILRLPETAKSSFGQFGVCDCSKILHASEL